LHANYLRNLSPVSSFDTTLYKAATGRIPDLSHLRVFSCNVWYRQGSQAKFKILNCDKAILGTFISFEGTHIVQALNRKGRIIRATAAHFQEQHTTPPGGAKHQCLEPLDHLDEDFDLPFRTAWFNNPDSDKAVVAALNTVAKWVAKLLPPAAAAAAASGLVQEPASASSTPGPAPAPAPASPAQRPTR
jgi:hypothetical protein